ncbi:acetyl-CoA hydrolase [Glycocaulis profundi]|nr:acetyl-CoA hydrolase [Glycocaulis profundi]
MTDRPFRHDSAEAAADAIIEAVGKTIVLGLPLGLGKPAQFANALYRRAVEDPSIRLTIFTALTLDVPEPSSDIEARLVGPIYERLYGGYEALDYATARRKGALPPNVEVHEFFLQPGALKDVASAQADYVSSNYTLAPRDILDRNINVIAQMVAVDGDERDRVSLSCNPDITLDLMDAVAAGRRGERTRIHVVGQVHDRLPYMTGPAEVEAEAFDHLIEHEALNTTLFGIPRRPVSPGDWATGLHIAGLVKDGGTLQIGIGALGDAVAAALMLRHARPELFARTLDGLTVGERRAEPETGPFEEGLFGCSEMFVEGFLQLYRAGVLKRRVYPDLDVQTAVDAGQAPPEDMRGHVMEGGFFLGPPQFYERLAALTPEERADLPMMAISWMNQLHGDEALKRAQRRDARFINTGMIATLLGAVVSDQLEDGRVISGVGGQYNFVAQGHALEGARSILAVRAVREGADGPRSNIVFSYGHVTIPRHLRDVVVTEYGAADLRGRSDAECVAAMLAIADSRFQDDLLDQAKKAGKISGGYVIPDAFRRNTPERLNEAMAAAKKDGELARFPFGTELTDTEIALAGTLKRLQALAGKPVSNAPKLLSALMASPQDRHREALERMGLDAPTSLKEKALSRLIAGLMG